MAVVSLKGGGTRTGVADLKTPEGLEALARRHGLEPPKKRRVLSAVRRVAGVLGASGSFVAGAVGGALDPERGALSSGVEAFRKSLAGRGVTGFADVAREQGVNPTTKLGKIALASTGFVADVLFDPLTYLTFGLGAGLKVGSKTLTKAGTRTFQRIATETTERLGRKGAGRTRILFEQAVGKKGITQEGIERFLRDGLDINDINIVKELGPTLIDKGGIKLFGKSLISSKALANSFVGKAARRLGQTEIAQALKNTLGRTFIADFAKNPKLVSILDKASRAQKVAVQAIIKNNETLFKGLSDKQMSELFDTIFQKKLQIAEVGEEALEEFGSSITQREFAKQVQKTEKLVFEDAALQKVSDQLFEGPDAIIPRFAKAAGISDDAAIKFYVPSKFMDKLAVKDFAVGRTLSSPSLGFQKKFRGAEKGLIRDPFEAFSRGQVEVATARIKNSASRSVAKSLGRPIEAFSEQEAKRLGMKKFSRKGVGGEKIEAWIPESIHDELTKFLEPKLKTIDELARVTGFDWATGLFKGYVTSLFPAFHVRNITSNQFLNMTKVGVDVLNPVLQKQALDIAIGRNLHRTITTKTGKVMTLREVRDQVMKESDILEQGAFGRMEQLLDSSKATLRRSSKLSRFNIFSRENFFLLAGGRKIGQTAEQQAKMVGVLSAVMEGKGVKAGVKQAEEALFNYGKLTEFERSVMRRLIPFYTFSRKNFELQLRTLATTPGRTAAQLKAVKGVDVAVGQPLTEEDLKGLPDFVLEGLGIKAGMDRFGRDTFLTGLGLPIEEFLERFSGDKSILNNVISDSINRSNPLIKFPLERATGQDFFRGRPIAEITNAKSLKGFIDVLPEPVAEEFKELIQWQEIPNQPVYVNGKVVARRSKFTANPFALHFMRNLFTSRVQSTIGFVSDEEESGWNRALRAFTGVRGWSIDQEQQRYFSDRARMKELGDYLQRMGVVGEYKTFFEPKQ